MIGNGSSSPASGPPPLVVINAVGLTGRLLRHAPRLARLAASGWQRPLSETLPAVTCTAQASFLTGQPPRVHGIVANGWLHRDTMEVRFWHQSNHLIQAPTIEERARAEAQKRGRAFRSVRLFWWFNQGAPVDLSVTPKPHYGADGAKVFAIDGDPRQRVHDLEKKLGPFPFRAFWGPAAGLASTRWIARCAAEVIADQAQGIPDLTLVYLPHLDYDLLRFGPSGAQTARLVGELDDACGVVLDAAERVGARVWVLSEYGHVDVSHAVEPNRLLRQRGWLRVRPGPFGEMVDLFGSRALAVCDHQLAHVYLRDPADLNQAIDLLAGLPGVAAILSGDGIAAIELDHPRCGELVLLAEPGSWFAYPYWLDDRQAPDFARTVDIHRKPGFDPCELFVDPALRWPQLRVARRLLAKKLGQRTLFDVVPLDTSLVRGSHGLRAADPLDRPLWIGDGPQPHATPPLTAVHDAMMEALGLLD